MEIKPGYKLTHVGVIPEEWEVARIGDQSQIFGRIGFRGYTVDDIVEDGAGAVAINPSNIQDGKIVFDKCTYITWRKYEESPEIKIDENDIVLVKTGSTFGKTAMVKKLPGKATLNPQVVVFKKIKPSKVFFGYMIGFPIVQNQVTSAVVGGALPTLSQRLVAEFKFPLPPLSEQRAIAQALSDVDDLITALNLLIAKKRDIKQATMQQLLTGKTRLPGFSGKWETKRLGDLAEMGSGGTPLSSVAAYYDGEIPWVSISDMTKGGKTIEATERNLTALGFSNSAAQMFPSGTILYAMYASIGECSIAGVPLCTSQAILGIQPKEMLRTDFLYYYLTSLKAQVKTLGQQGTQANLNKGIVQDFKLGLPTVGEQAAIAAVLSDMDDELTALEARRDKTRALKQGMMQ
jgi:type I restriction enzyme S subunit